MLALLVNTYTSHTALCCRFAVALRHKFYASGVLCGANKSQALQAIAQVVLRVGSKGCSKSVDSVKCRLVLLGCATRVLLAPVLLKQHVEPGKVAPVTQVGLICVCVCVNPKPSTLNPHPNKHRALPPP